MNKYCKEPYHRDKAYKNLANIRIKNGISEKDMATAMHFNGYEEAIEKDVLRYEKTGKSNHFKPSGYHIALMNLVKDKLIKKKLAKMYVARNINYIDNKGR